MKFSQILIIIASFAYDVKLKIVNRYENQPHFQSEAYFIPILKKEIPFLYPLTNQKTCTKLK